MKPLFIPLKSEFFEAFRRGEKKTEYRLYGARWNGSTCAPGRPVVLSKGYGKHARLYGQVQSFSICTSPAGLPGWRECYGENPAHVAACITVRLSETEEPAHDR